MDKENDPAPGRSDLTEIRQRLAGLHLVEKTSLPIDKTQNSSGVSSPAASFYPEEQKLSVPHAKTRVSTTPLTGINNPRAAAESNMMAADQAQLAQLTDEILAYCHLLDSSRKRALDDCTGLRTNIKELEKLLESARQREVAHLSYVEQQREAMAMFEKRYYTLKSRAKGLIKDSQEERDKICLELDELRVKTNTMEAKLYSAQTLSDEQAKELERLRELSKNTPSERELQEMRLSILKLKDENGRLATERASLIDDMKNLRKKSAAGSGAGPGREALAKREEELELTIQTLSRNNQELRQALDKSDSQVDELKNYVSALLDNLESMKSCQTD